MLISDEVKNHVNNKDWQKEKNLINKLYRASSSEDLDKDIDTAAEATPIISNQGTVKVQIQSRLSGSASPLKTLHCPLKTVNRPGHCPTHDSVPQPFRGPVYPLAPLGTTVRSAGDGATIVVSRGEFSPMMGLPG
ncbi:UNVERIFIED_CONTAM: hypothetical protein FKN15_041114 [Acipenser sinensis]